MNKSHDYLISLVALIRLKPIFKFLPISFRAVIYIFFCISALLGLICSVTGGGFDSGKRNSIYNYQALCLNWGTGRGWSYIWTRGQYNGICTSSLYHMHEVDDILRTIQLKKNKLNYGMMQLIVLWMICNFSSVSFSGKDIKGRSCFNMCRCFGKLKCMWQNIWGWRINIHNLLNA